LGNPLEGGLPRGRRHQQHERFLLQIAPADAAHLGIGSHDHGGVDLPRAHGVDQFLRKPGHQSHLEGRMPVAQLHQASRNARELRAVDRAESHPPTDCDRSPVTQRFESVQCVHDRRDHLARERRRPRFASGTIE
jgi:hypothetical protein